jgi:polyamine oxidase
MPNSISHTKPTPRVLIIGAGLAGLAAANELLSHNIDVRVLEARQRIGGRTWTNDSLGVPMDEGAFIIHGVDHNPIALLAEDNHLRFSELKVGKVYFAQGSECLSEEAFDLIDEQFQVLLDEAHQFAMSQMRDVPLTDAIDAVFDGTQFPLLTPKILAWRKLFLSQYTAANLKQLSAQHWQDAEVPFAGGNYMMLDGYKPLVEVLAKDIPIELSAIVSHIDYGFDEVIVKTNQGEFKADAVIVTLPLGVLQNTPNLFSPALPEAKQKSIDKLRMGVLNKFILRFSHAFWPEDCRLISLLQESYSEIAWFFNHAMYCHQPILMGFVSEEMACRYERLSDDEIVAEVMASLRKVFGSDIPQPLDTLITRWHSDPFSFGSYSYIPVDASGADYDRLADPLLNKVFFAGEATNKQLPGTTQGAYLSGLRAASEFLITQGCLDS